MILIIHSWKRSALRECESRVRACALSRSDQLTNQGKQAACSFHSLSADEPWERLGRCIKTLRVAEKERKRRRWVPPAPWPQVPCSLPHT